MGEELLSETGAGATLAFEVGELLHGERDGIRPKDLHGGVLGLLGGRFGV